MARVSVEDCIKKLSNRFALVIVAANRTRQLMGSSQPLVRSHNKPGVIALREIAEGKIIQKGIYQDLNVLDIDAGPTSELSYVAE